MSAAVSAAKVKRESARLTLHSTWVSPRAEGEKNWNKGGCLSIYGSL